MIFQYFNRRSLKRHEMVWLEITPPASIAKTPEATEQLFSVIHSMRSVRTVKERVLRRSPVMSFEITSSKEEGVRYLIQTEKSRSDTLQKAIAAYIPYARVKEIERDNDKSDEVVEFTETSHYILPLTLTEAFAQHDPLSYVTAAMTKLSSGNQVTLQLVIRPIRLRGTSGLAHKILRNEDILSSARSRVPLWMQRLSNILLNMLWGTTDLASEAYHGTAYGTYKTKSNDQESAHKSQVLKGQKPARSLSTFEQEIMASMHKKVTQPLFQVNLRILARGDQAKRHVNELRVALGGYSVPLYQSLKAKPRLPIVHAYRHKLADARLPSLTHQNGLVLSASELAGFYHFPPSTISRTDNLITSLSRTLPAPVSLQSGKKLSVIIGENHHHGIVTSIGLTEQERERHEYIIGGTGNGKTTLLQYQIVQDMKNNKGVAIIDPHGDMAEAMLRHVLPERINDVIYFNPDDLEYPIGLNLLELTPGLTGNELLREKDIITESVISVFRKIFSDEDTGGHRIEYVLRNAVQTALTVENATLFTVFDLINDPKYRKNIVKTLEDKNLVNFWKNELGKAGDMQKVKMAAGITAKIGRFLFSASARQILEQPKSTIDFDDIINNGKILICNFSKGLIGEDTSELFGITVLAKLQLASLRRARLEQAERRPFYLYVDEFQNFATTSFVQMLSEARKYKLFLTMAEQSTSQQDDQQMVSIILANVGTVICFRTGNPQDEQKLLPLFSPYIEQGEISNLPAFNFYAKLSAVRTQEPLSGQTLLLNDEGSGKIRDAVVKHSHEAFAKKQIEQAVASERPDTLKLEKQPAKAATKSKTKRPSEASAKPSKVNLPGF